MPKNPYEGIPNFEKENFYIRKQEEEELSEIRELTTKDDGEFLIVSPKETDSLGTDCWKSYLNRKKLLEAWSSPEGSPYIKFFKTKTINSVEFVGHKIKPRYSAGEEKSQRELDNLINSGELGPGTAIILDSGGAHSIAMAVKLAEYGFQPVVMLDSIPHSRGIVAAEQDLAVLLYFAEEMSRLKKEGKIKPDAPPLFILNAHRYDIDISFGRDKTKLRNTYTYKESDFPSAEELQKLGIKKSFILTKAIKEEKLDQSFNPLIGL
jgi:hypothetical protein